MLNLANFQANAHSHSKRRETWNRKVFFESFHWWRAYQAGFPYSPRLDLYKPEMGRELHVGTQCLVTGHTLNLKWNIFAQRDQNFLCKRWKWYWMCYSIVIWNTKQTTTCKDLLRVTQPSSPLPFSTSSYLHDKNLQEVIF